MNSKGLILIIIIAIGIFMLFSSVYIVDETEQVVVTQFGRVIGGPIKEPGLKFRIPFIQHPNYFPKNLLQWDGSPGQIPTRDKTFIWVEAFARWKIVEPVKFFQTVNNLLGGISRLEDIIDPAVRNFITSYPLIEAVRLTNRDLDILEEGLEEEDIQQDPKILAAITLGRQKITEGILEQAQPKLNQFGIELVDVKIKRINYVEEVQRTVFDRMIAERKQIAEKFRSEGRGEAQIILGDKERDLKQILSDAYRRSEEIKGDADAEATIIYASAHGLDPEFYSFLKTLEIYTQALDDKNSLILSTDSEFFKYLKGFEEFKP
ncbi:MAG: protease modulator HflC [Desulfobacterales bacterium]